MKHFIHIVFILLACSIQAQDSIAVIDTNKLHQQFEKAYLELEDMLEGRQSLDFKRAVFVSENAFYEGKLNYTSYCETITDLTNHLYDLMNVNGWDSTQTHMKHTALFNFMTYFNETLVKSITLTTLFANQNVTTRTNILGDIESDRIEDGNAITINFPANIRYSEKPCPSCASKIIQHIPEENRILVTKDLIEGGIYLDLDGGGSKLFDPEHAVLHEFAHAIMNTIMNEFNGQFNGVDFNEMSDQERDDWAIQYTNTLLQSMGVTLESGDGQHNRPDGDTSNDNTPLTK